MNASDAGRQIKQMTEHDFNLEKQMLEHNAKLKIQESTNAKRRSVNARSAEIGALRRQKMIARDELLKTLIVEVQSQLKDYTTLDDKNKILLRDLIVQGLIKLFETDVVVAVRAKDVQLAEMMIMEATDKYIATMKKEANLDVSKVKVTVNKIADGMLPDASGSSSMNSFM
ncbi:unnamed protein product [Peronospora destructor]|uniref:Uncharacterized protein n=1 Tax=Peronospora destructor TaxID=86335 RepID=A0AAV0UG93_9STRA|nr:unnamed protein product [Peronospora destructor]